MAKNIWSSDMHIPHLRYMGNLHLSQIEKAGTPAPAKGSIWHNDRGPSPGKTYKSNQSGSFISSFASPSSDPDGIAQTSDGCLWSIESQFCIGLNKIYKENQTGSKISSFATPCDSPAGLTSDGNDSLWYVEGNCMDMHIYKLNQTGSQISSFISPSCGGGITMDSTGCLWFCNVKIWKLNQTGSQISSFTEANALRVAIDGSGCLWYTDDNNDKIFKINQTGSEISSFATPCHDPIGIEIEYNDRDPA